MLFDHPDFDAHRQVHVLTDTASGLRAILAIHRLVEGRSVGGVRMRRYASDSEALADALRLSRAMTVKAALAGLPFGGAKTVILGDPARDASPPLFRALGRFIGELDGRYHCGPDVGTGPAEMDLIAEETAYVGATTAQGGSSAPPTALGVFHAIRATVRHLFGSDSLAGHSIAVQGAGGVGRALAKLLTEAGVRVLIADVDAAAVADLRATVDVEVLPPDALPFADVDILAPCALGAVLNVDSIPRLRARGVCGAANNQLATPEDGELLRARGIAFVPDAVASAGGIIDGLARAGAVPAGDTAERLAGIHDTALAILQRSAAENVSAAIVAERLARERIGE